MRSRCARSRRRRRRASAGRFASEITPVEIPQKKGDPKRFEQDEFIRPDTTLEMLGEAEAGVPHRRQGLGHGGQLVGAQRRRGGAADRVGQGRRASSASKPLARIVATAVAGVEPRIMGMGPVPASRKALEQAGLTLDQMDVIELNEAFAAQSLACLRELGIADDDPRVNPNGGAIALGHPLGMSGARLLLTAARELEQTGGSYALATMCIGVGQGMATIIERV